jgi:oligosaccharide repeat unit polymerase
MIFDFVRFRSSALFACEASAYGAGGLSVDRAPEQKSLYLRPDWSLPFYCHPVKLFVTAWTLMLIALAFRISYSSYPSMGLPILLFGISLLSLLCGYQWFGSSDNDQQAGQGSSRCMLNVTRLRNLNWVFTIICIAIMLLNLKLDGLPPAFGLFSFDTKMYLDYGRLKQVLFPLLITIVVNSSLDPSRFRKILFSLFALLSMLFYITRGEILASLLQTFFVFSMTSRLPKKKLLIAAILTVLGMTVIANLIGNNRTAQEAFLKFLDIRGEFWNWPMIALWVISYFSIPLSNLCWIVRDFHFHSITFSFLYQVLPAFWFPADPHENILSDSHIVDGVHTYLGNYFMDFSYAGVLLANIALGAACALVVRRGRSRHFLTTAVFLACVANIFFNDNFTPLSTLVQLAIQAFVQRYILTLARERPLRAALRTVA